MIPRRLARGLFAAVALLLAALFLAPLWAVLQGGFRDEDGFTLRPLLAVLADPVYVAGLRNSLGIAVAVTILSSLIAVPLAWIADRWDFAGKRWLTGLLLAPMILPPFLGAVGWQQLLGRYGAINALFGTAFDWLGGAGATGVVVLESLALFPIVYLNAAAALANLDPALGEAAANLGATGWSRFRRVTLPLIAPGLFAGGVLVFLWSFTELGTPLMLNYVRCAPVQVFDALKEMGADATPYALVTVLLLASLLLYCFGRLLFGRGGRADGGRGVRGARAERLHGARAALAAAPFALVLGVALLPHLAVVLTSFAEPGSWYATVLPERLGLDHWREALGHPLTVASIGNSLAYSALALSACVVIGTAVALLVARSDLRLRGALDAFAMLPLAVPGLVLAFGYLAWSSRLANEPWVKESAFWRGLLDVRENPTLFLAIAYAVRRLPYLVRGVVAGLQQTPVELEEAAQSLGCAPLRAGRCITLPLISANLIAGALLAFAFSMLEVSDSLILAQRQDHYPITKAIFELFQLLGAGPYLAAALGVWAMAFLGLTILAASLVFGRRLGALFRA